MTSKLQADRSAHIPKSYQMVMPYLILKDAKGFIEYMKTVFDGPFGNTWRITSAK